MLNELAVLKAFLSKDKFLSFNSFFRTLTLESEIEKILNAIDEYYQQHPEADEINLQDLTVFFYLSNPSLNKQDIYKDIFKKLEELNVNSGLLNSIFLRILEKYYSAELIGYLSEVLEDEEYGILNTLIPDTLEKYFAAVEKINSGEAEKDFLDPDLTKLVEQEILADGLSWRLNCLNATVGPLRGGSLGHVFARVDTGKTSFLISEVTNFAQQLKDDEIIAWFGNEEKGDRIQLRIYSSMLAVPKEILVKNVETSRETFKRNNGFAIKIHDDASITTTQVEKILKKYNVRLAIIDQGDKVRFRGDKTLAEHERLKKLYGKFRELAKTYNCDIITAGQASAEAAGKMFIQLTHMDNSKTGKPGELDFAIGIGALLEGGSEERRYINVCKNKLFNGSKGQFAVHFDALIARFTDYKD